METKQGYFNPTMPRPLDRRYFKATVADILNIPTGARYVGMEIYAYDDDEWYQFVGGVADGNLQVSDRGGAAIQNRYADTTAMLADQINQIEGGIQFVLDASGDPQITTGWAYYDYLNQGAGTVAGDYRRIASQEENSVPPLADGKGTTVRDENKIDIGGGDLIDASATVGVGAGADFRIENPADSGTNKYTNRIRIQDNYGWQLRRRNDNTGNRGTLLMESWNAGGDGEVIDIVGNNQETGAIAGLQVRRDGLLHVGDVWSAGATANFFGLKYRADYPNIDWANDGLLIPHQNRVIEIGTEQGWDVPNESVQEITIDEAGKTNAIALNATANVIKITLAADLTSDAKPSGWTGWIEGRQYAIHFIKKGTYGFDGSDALAANDIGYDDDIEPFGNLDVITTTQQRAVIHADGFNAYGQFGRMILTGTNYVEP